MNNVKNSDKGKGNYKRKGKGNPIFVHFSTIFSYVV